jgi:hypothetical protein
MDAPDEGSGAVGGGDEEDVWGQAGVVEEEALVGAGQRVAQVPEGAGPGGDVEALEDTQAPPQAPALEEDTGKVLPGQVVGLQRQAMTEAERDGDGHRGLAEARD